MYWTLLKLVGFLLLLYLLIMILAIPLQRNLLYFPMQASEERLIREAAYSNLTPWINDKGAIIGWKSQSISDPSETNFVVVFHGNAGNAVYRDYFVDGFQDQENHESWQVYLFEYPGYGARPGNQSEKAIKRAASSALDELIRLKPRSLSLVGESLGCGVASHLAGSYSDRVDGLLLVNAYPSMVEVAKVHYSFLPVNLLLRERYNVEKSLRNYNGPTVFLYGELDQIVPPALTKQTFESYHGPKKLISQPNSGHNSMDYHPKAKWWDEVNELWLGEGISN
jgi:pimeloyl-ACP methyl ester carboxylesterase